VATGGIFQRAPRKIRQLVADLEQAGFVGVPGGKGSHREFRHPKGRGSLILSGLSGDDAKQYQEKQVLNAIHKVSQTRFR
jgi:predicted RNA binding protein YcfA (HicA-like mRNA interferase family)